MNKPTLLKIVRSGLVASLVSLASAGTASAAGMSNPTTNRVLSGATLTACMNAPTSADCTNDTLNDIDAARAAEGVGPMVLPADYATLSVPEQLLVVANLERADRGMKVLAIGLAPDLNANAQTAAAADEDPIASPWNGDSMSSNWAGGYDTPLEADFSWMYDDGLGSPNQDCTASNSSGCWGHREDILMNFDPPLVMGAAVATGQYGTSMTQLFVGGDTASAPGQADAPVGLTWSQISGQPSQPTDTGSTVAAPPATQASAPTAPVPSSPTTTKSGSGAPSGSRVPARPAAAKHPVARPASPSAHAAKCTVPRLRGLPLARAIRALVRAHCGVGEIISARATISSVHRVHHRRRKLNGLRVIRQSVRAGSHRRSGFRVVLHVR